MGIVGTAEVAWGKDLVSNHVHFPEILDDGQGMASSLVIVMLLMKHLVP
jgi:hypothetical protein